MQPASFISGIQMYAYANEHGPEGKMILSPYHQLLKKIVIQNPVIDPFTGSTFTVNIFVLLGIPGDTRVETQVSEVLYVDSAPISARGAGFSIRAGVDASALKWAAVFVSILDGIVPPGNHLMPRPAERMPQFVKSNVRRCVFRRLCASIDINESIDIPVLQQLVGRKIVMSRIQTDIFRKKPIGTASESINGIKEIFAVMASGTGKVYEDGELYFKVAVSGTEHVKGAAKKPSFFIAVPTPGGIRVRIMPAAGIAERAFSPAGGKMFPIRRGV